MAAAAVTLVTARQIIPNTNASLYTVTYSKTNVGDTIDCSFSDGISTTTNGPFLPIKTIRFVAASDGTVGAVDPATYATTVITLSAGTDAGRLIVIGNC